MRKVSTSSQGTSCEQCGISDGFSYFHRRSSRIHQQDSSPLCWRSFHWQCVHAACVMLAGCLLVAT